MIAMNALFRKHEANKTHVLKRFLYFFTFASRL
jgi:hypothetical protein